MDCGIASGLGLVIFQFIKYLKEVKKHKCFISHCTVWNINAKLFLEGDVKKSEFYKFIFAGSWLKSVYRFDWKRLYRTAVRHPGLPPRDVTVISQTCDDLKQPLTFSHAPRGCESAQCFLYLHRWSVCWLLLYAGALGCPQQKWIYPLFSHNVSCSWSRL